jgi:hypothetical protein
MSTTSGTSVNISVSGLLAEVATDIPLGIEIRIAVQLPGEAAPLELKALGVRIRAVPSREMPYEVALAFIQTADTALRRLSEFVFGG